MAGKSINRSIRIFVNGKEVEHSLINVKKEMTRLNREVGLLERGTKEYVQKSAELRKVTNYWKEMKAEISGIPTVFDKLKQSAGGFTTIVGGFLTFTTIADKLRQLIDMAAELSDWQANVQKTTGMTRKEVQALTKDLDELNTRTSREDLLAIAEEGGRIGVPKEEIAEFTKEMDKANVALGDSFDSVEDVAGSLGKLRNLYEETKNQGVAQAFNGIGSALNELGAAGVASEKNVADFATRVGALPNAFKPAIADALGLGAAFEESGVDAEVASRSYGILIQTAAKNTGAFAQVMGISKKEVEDLINTNPVEFFLQFTKSVSALDKDGVKTAKMLDALGIGADGVNKIIGAGAAGNDRFRQTLDLANQSMEEGTSLAKEFSVKNENLGASVEKIKKEFVEWVTDQRVVDFIEALVTWFGRLIGAVDDTGKETSTLVKILDFTAKAIGVLIASMVAYSAATRLATLLTRKQTEATLLQAIADKGAAAAKRLYTIVVSAASVVINTLTGKTYAAMRAQVALNAVTKANPWGLLIGAIAAVISAIVIFTKETKKAVDSKRALNDALLESKNSIAKEKLELEQLIKIARDENISRENRIKAINRLKEIMPEYAKLLSLENIQTQQVTDVLAEYNKELRESARIKSLNAKYDVLSDQKLEKEKQSGKEYKSGTQSFADSIYGAFGKKTPEFFSEKEIEDYVRKNFKAGPGIDYEKMVDIEVGRILESSGINNKMAEISAIEAQMTEIEKELFDRRKQNPGGESQSSELTGIIPESGKTKTGKSASEIEKEHLEKIWADILAIEKEKNAALLSAQRESEAARIELMDEGYEKEVQKLESQNRQRKEDLQNDIIARNEVIKQIEAKAQAEKKDGHHKEAAEYDRLAKEQIAINEEKNQLITLSDETTASKRKALWFEDQTERFEGLKKEFEEQQKKYSRDLMNLETHHNNELNSVKNLEDAKKVLRDKYNFSQEQLDAVKSFEKAKEEIVLAQQQETVDKQIEILKDQIKQWSDLIGSELSGRMNFGVKLLSDEALDELLENIEIAQNALSKITGEGGDEPDELSGKEKDGRRQLMSNIDLLGFSADDWDQAFEALEKAEGKFEKLAAIAKIAGMGIQTMTNAFGMFYEMQNKNIERDLTAFESSINRKKSALANQLEQGFISQETYNAKVAKLDADLEKKRAEAEYKQQLNEWKMKMLEANASLALSIMNSLALGPPQGYIFAAITGALGAIQIGMLAKNKPKKPSGYFSGGPTSGSGEYDQYGRELADGPFHADEYVIPKYLRRDPAIAAMEKFIEAKRRGMSPNLSRPDGYAEGGVTQPARPSETDASESSSINAALLVSINRLNDNLEYMMTHPLQAEIADSVSNGKKIDKMINDFKSWFNKGKR